MIIEKYSFNKKILEKLIEKYDNDEEIKNYLEELIQKNDDARSKRIKF